jgi:hypothetical protein
LFLTRWGLRQKCNPMAIYHVRSLLYPSGNARGSSFLFLPL